MTEQLEPGRAAWQRRTASVVGLVGIVALYVWDDVLFAGPVVASVRIIGLLPTFLIFSLLFGTLNFVGALLAVRAYDRFSKGEPNRLENWLDKQASSRRGLWAQRMIRSGKIIGFVASSFLLGGIVTTWIVRFSGRREHIRMVALASSTVFAVTFVGAYSGIGQLVFGR